MRGGEKVLEELAHLFPKAPVYTMVARPKQLSASLQKHTLRTSALQSFPGVARYYKNLLPFFPLAVQMLQVQSDTDFILSTDASIIKGISNPKLVPHVCYCHSPPRYLWDMQDTYMDNTSNLGPLGRLAFRYVTPFVRKFDQEAARRVSHFIANSRFVQNRIEKYYGRESTVIYPPVSVQDLQVGARSDDFYLIISQLVPYKRVDIAVEAFTRLKKRLVVIGEGSELGHLRKMAGPTVEFLGSQSFSVLKRHYETCRAFIFPGIEDFGITPLEAQAAGKPVIGFAEGGLLETTLEGKTALYFHQQTADALIDAVRRFEAGALDYDPQVCRAHAEAFSPEKFRAAIQCFLIEKYPALFTGFSWGDA